MTTATLFGIALAPLYAAIAHIESDCGATSTNVYQIQKIYVDDVNRILRGYCDGKVDPYVYSFDQVSDQELSEKMMVIYWRHWGIHYQKKTGNPVTCEVLARIHNGGPLGWKKPATVGYWKKVQTVMKGGAK